MEKELLEKRKVALKKLLNNKQYFYSGFCYLIAVLYAKSILTYEESGLLEVMLDSFYDESQDAREAEEHYGGYLWEPAEWEPREKWIISTIESIDLMLNQSKTT